VSVAKRYVVAGGEMIPAGITANTTHYVLASDMVALEIRFAALESTLRAAQRILADREVPPYLRPGAPPREVR
jgi:hypothetical protein